MYSKTKVRYFTNTNEDHLFQEIFFRLPDLNSGDSALCIPQHLEDKDFCD